VAPDARAILQLVSGSGQAGLGAPLPSCQCQAGAPVCAVAQDWGTGTAGASDSIKVQLRERAVLGQRMLYREAGLAANPPVLLLHGMTSSSWNITYILRALAANFHVVAPDHVGAGLHPAPRPATVEQAVAGMSDHVSALLDLLGLTRVAVVAQDIAACVTEELVASRRCTPSLWAVAVEALPRGPVPFNGSSPVLLPADRSPFHAAVHALLVAQEPAIAPAMRALSAAGMPTARFQAQQCIPDRWKSSTAQAGLHLVRSRSLTGAPDGTCGAAQHTYVTDQDGTPVDHELCRLGQWLTRFLLSHAPHAPP
jgi:pimeloyl-ACP methyl ester carboxylesterase